MVTVDVKLDFLEIQQCPGDYTVANAFKNTARCHFKSQYVSAVKYCTNIDNSNHLTSSVELIIRIFLDILCLLQQ